MTLSIFDMFKIGIGPSSSHTVGPMRAARRFAESLREEGIFHAVEHVRAELFGSLGATGKGHGSDLAVLLGLDGERPEEVDTDAAPVRVAAIAREGALRLLGERTIPFALADSLVFHRRQTLPRHPNGMRFTATGPAIATPFARTYYSVGGGFVVNDSDPEIGRAHV